MEQISRDQQCQHCGRFANRGVSIDAVIIEDNEILLVKRGAEPYKGFWATPGGYVEWDESTEDAVAREVKEETGLIVTSSKLVGVQSAPERHPKQVINLLYRVSVADKNFTVGDDAEEAKWFSLGDIPKQLAFDHKQNIDIALNS